MLATLLLLGTLQAQAPDSPDLELAPAPSSPTTTEQRPWTRSVIPATWAVVTSTVGGCVGAGVALAAGLSCMAVGSGVITSLIVNKEQQATVGGNVRSAFIDGMLFSILLATALTPVMVVGMIVLDAVAYSLVQPVRTRTLNLSSVWPVLATVVGTLPGGCLTLAGGVVFLTWLGVQPISDALMPVAVAMGAAGVLLVLVGVVVVRPLLHWALVLGWDHFNPP